MKVNSMSEGLKDNLMGDLYLCIKMQEHHDTNAGWIQMAQILDPQKELVTPKKLLMPRFFKRRSLSTFSTRRALSVIKNYWKE